MKATLFGFGLVLAAPSIVSAHPGHAGPGGVGWAHYLSDPYHLLLGVAAVLCAVVAGRIVSRTSASLLEKRSRRNTTA